MYYKNYNLKHKAVQLIKHSLYCISELNKKKLDDFRIIANPGCYPTSIQLPLVPLIKKLIDLNSITIDSKSGYLGRKNIIKLKHKNLYNSVLLMALKITNMPVK